MLSSPSNLKGVIAAADQLAGVAEALHLVIPIHEFKFAVPRLRNALWIVVTGLKMGKSSFVRYEVMISWQ